MPDPYYVPAPPQGFTIDGQPPQGQGLASPPPPPDQLGNIPITPAYRLQAQQAQQAHTNLLTQRDTATMPSQITEANANAKLAAIRAQNEANIPWDDATVDYVAHVMAGGAPITQITGGFGMGASGRVNQSKVIQRLAEIQGTKGLTGEDQAAQLAHYKAGSKALGTLETQYQTVQGSERTTHENMENYLRLSEGLPLQTGSPALNSVIQLGQKELPFMPGHDIKTAMDAAGLTGLNEYARVVSNSPTGAGILTDTARKEAQEIMKGNYAIDQKQAVWKLMQADMGNRLAALRQTLDENYKNLTVTPGYQVPSSTGELRAVNPTPQEIFDANDKLIHSIYEKAGQGVTPGGENKLSTTEQAIPFPPGYQAEHKAYLQQNMGHITPEDYIAFRKQMDQKYGVSEQPQDMDEVRKFVDAVNSGKSTTEIPAQNVPLSDEEKLRAERASSPAMTAVQNFGNAVTGGAVDLALSPEQREAEKLVNIENPKSAIAGDALGSIAPIVGIGKGTTALLERAGIRPDTIAALLGGKERAAALGAVAKNAAYGGIRGFNAADDGEGISGAAEGAVIGAAGGAGGELAAKGINPIFSDRFLGNRELLKGVKQTTLQRLGLGDFEQGIDNVPGVAGGRNKTLASFNTDNVNRALQNVANLDNAKIDVTMPKGLPPGPEQNAFLNSKLDEAYNAIRPQITGKATKQFTAAMKAAPEEAQPAITLFTKGGSYNGDSYQEASKNLRELEMDFSHQAENGVIGARDKARAVAILRQQMDNLVASQNGTIATDLKSINQGWAHSMRIEDATDRALATSKGQYGPSQYIKSIQKLDNRSTAQGKGFDQDYAMAAQDVLGSGGKSKPTLHGTFYGLGGLGGAAAGGVAIGAPHVVPMTVGLAYAPGIKKLTSTLLTGKRPVIVNNEATRAAIADTLRKIMSGMQ